MNSTFCFEEVYFSSRHSYINSVTCDNTSFMSRTDGASWSHFLRASLIDTMIIDTILARPWVKTVEYVASNIHICNLSVRVLLTSINHDKPVLKTFSFSQKVPFSRLSIGLDVKPCA